MAQQTAVEWLFEKLWDEPKDKFTWYALRQKAIEMEKEQTEISDEEIEKQSKYWNETTNPDMWTFKLAWKVGAKWYREQLKKKYNSEKVNSVPYRIQNEAN
jgi:hypothetical protein